MDINFDTDDLRYLTENQKYVCAKIKMQRRGSKSA